MSRQASPVCVERDGHLTQPLLLAAAPRGVQADVEGQAAVQPEKRREEATAVWRATIPGTVACTLALFVQKMVRSVLRCTVLRCAVLRWSLHAAIYLTSLSIQRSTCIVAAHTSPLTH